ncbi:3',5'-cyclic AMP phosphodiesterase CpdA [Mariniphaga anaerophila]|uniref:3',5'-cyclic AMP phosphodiesterase CpdA n=1 Tax=Mariniphaga anaerophila TaxID=1484053 RepID=A0A1M5APC5_9BACT|nr:metallophosphoesterase family protein [Mariniphaga anaerophila]SHF32110.1 3',5'-cyclic AMP phosphodiesterase CpdA [Mariniphaga anaerophila]
MIKNPIRNALLLAFFVSSFCALGQNKNALKFDSSGEFKIAQFTDTHINMDKNSNLDVYEIVRGVLKKEQPDFVILTGDIVTQANPVKGYDLFAELFSEFEIPWAVVFGNHDSQHDFSRESLAGYLKELPFCLNDDVGGIAGNSNFILPVYGQSSQVSALLYCFDSHSRSTLQPVVDGYGWFDYSQIMWYRDKSAEYSRVNNGKPVPALAFFHIPLPEYTAAWNNKSVAPVGVKNEDECSPDINTGMFAAMLECGDVMGTFVGHDHINDYIGVHYNIALAYGRVSKVMKGADDPLAGGRIIVLKEGRREFDTWIRNMKGTTELQCNWPETFFPKEQ